VAGEQIGNYKLVKQMATGQMSQVYEVVEVSSGRHFAMKLLLPEKVENPEARAFLLHEAEVGLKMAHPNIIRIMSVNKSKTNPHFVMEFFPAGSLKVRLMRKEVDFIREKGQDILKGAATALAFLNAKGWVHRDIKPDNLLVSSSGDVKLIDFAIAQEIPTGYFQKLFWRKPKVQGTRSYMSPEQIRGQPLDGRSDIYSFGAMAYEMVCNRAPFIGSTAQDLLARHFTEKPVPPATVNPSVTKEFSELIIRLLGKKKVERPRDFHEVLMAMRAIRLFKAEV
jgi:eukaryotic-like serine/threonine-protein kinase